MKKALVSFVILGCLIFSGNAACTQGNYLTMFHAMISIPRDPLLQYYDPGGPTYGCYPTGASCNLNCNNWSWWCLAYCTLLGNPTGYYCVAGCQYICVDHFGRFYFQCRDVIEIGCVCDVQPRECPEAG